MYTFFSAIFCILIFFNQVSKIFSLPNRFISLYSQVGRDCSVIILYETLDSGKFSEVPVFLIHLTSAVSAYEATTFRKVRNVKISKWKLLRCFYHLVVLSEESKTMNLKLLVPLLDIMSLGFNHYRVEMANGPHFFPMQVLNHVIIFVKDSSDMMKIYMSDALKREPDPGGAYWQVIFVNVQYSSNDDRFHLNQYSFCMQCLTPQFFNMGTDSTNLSLHRLLKFAKSTTSGNWKLVVEGKIATKKLMSMLDNTKDDELHVINQISSEKNFRQAFLIGMLNLLVRISNESIFTDDQTGMQRHRHFVNGPKVYTFSDYAPRLSALHTLGSDSLGSSSDPEVLLHDVTIVGSESLSFLTCHAPKFISFSAYSSPFQSAMWLWLFLTANSVSIFLCVLIFTQSNLSRTFDRIICSTRIATTAVFGTLLEQSFSVPEKLEKSLAFRISIGTWIVLNIIITNAYKGIAITEITSPLPGKSPDLFTDLAIYFFKCEPRNFSCKEEHGKSRLKSGHPEDFTILSHPTINLEPGDN